MRLDIRGDFLMSPEQSQKAKDDEAALQFDKDQADIDARVSAMSDDDKRQNLSECINKYLDIDRITKAVFSPLGYNNIPSKYKERVKKFMEKELIRFYAGEGKLAAMVNAKLSGKLAAEARESDFAVKTNFKKDSSSVEIVWITNGEKVYYVEIAGFNQITTLRSEMKGKVGSEDLMVYINRQLAE